LWRFRQSKTVNDYAASDIIHATQKNLLRLSIWTLEADLLGRAIGNIGAFEQMSYPRSLPSFFD
jgi:hypothetical protein